MSYRILSELNFTNLVDLADLAKMVSEFYDLEVIVAAADFAPSLSRADLCVITPNGKTVVLFHASIYLNEKHWSLGGQDFATSSDMRKLSDMREQERKQ